MATVGKADLLQRISPELRVEIYKYVLTSPGRLKRETHRCFAVLLSVTTYVYKEAVDVLYGNNTFTMTLEEVERFGNATNFCEIRLVHLLHVCDKYEDGVFGIRTLVRQFLAKAQCLAARTQKRFLALQTVTVSVPDLDYSYLDDMRQCTFSGYIQDVAVGAWEVKLGQPYTVRFEHCQLVDGWAHIEEQASISITAAAFADDEPQTLVLRQEIDRAYATRDSVRMVRSTMLWLALKAWTGYYQGPGPEWLEALPWLSPSSRWHLDYSVKHGFDAVMGRETVRLWKPHTPNDRRYLAWINNTFLQALDCMALDGTDC